MRLITKNGSKRLMQLTLVATAAVSISGFAQAANSEASGAPDETDNSVFAEKSPWIIAPVLNSNPKLGTAVGALAGYIHFFDEKSRPSIFALTGQYTSTDSIIAGAFAKASFDEDKQRVIAALAFGNVKNDYADYLGTGVPLQNDATLKSFIGRYTYRIKGDWFVGLQGVSQNFNVTGQSEFDEQVLDILGVKPFKATGAGVVIQNDTRDNDNMPTKGWFFNFNTMAYNEADSDVHYDVYRAEFRYYIPQNNGSVFAIRQLNHLTKDAPAASRAPVQLRGYKIGQYTGEYMSSIEGEQRFKIAEKWTTSVFAGVACLYGSGVSCADSKNIFPAVGAGVQYILKPQAGVVMNLEVAQGKEGNQGLFLKMGYTY